MFFKHQTAEISIEAVIGKNTKIWHYAQIRERSIIGENCIIGKNVYIDFDVVIGSNCKIQNNCSIYHGAVIGNGVFIGPNVVITNDKMPRAVNEDGTLKKSSDWKLTITSIQKGASIGSSSVILPGLTIGQYSMIGAGSVVSKNVPDFAIVFGNPANIHGYICVCEKRIIFKKNSLTYKCRCGRMYNNNNGKLTFKHV